jgi:hypothetical protein
MRPVACTAFSREFFVFEKKTKKTFHEFTFENGKND